MRFILSLLLFPLLAFSQAALILPWVPEQFLDNNGKPLAGGRIYFCVSGSSCPGTPQVTYNSSSASTPNANPIILDGSGRIPAGIWLAPGLVYKFVLTSSTGAVVSTIDNIMGSVTSIPTMLTPGGAITNVQYKATSTTLGGSSNFTWNNASQLLSVTATDSAHASIVGLVGFIQSDKGFLATGATAVEWDAFHAPAGGVGALSGTFVNYVQTGNAAGPGAPNPTLGDTHHYGSMYYDIALASERLCTLATCLPGNPGTGWVNLSAGGSGSPVGPTSAVQYNAGGGSFGGDAAMEWNTSTHLLTITTVGAVAGLAIDNGFGQADRGFLATSGTCLLWNCFASPTGGIGALSGTFANYVQIGNTASGTPTATSGDTFHAGAAYWDCGGAACSAGTGSAKIYNGTAWVTLATGGATSPGGANTNVQFQSGGAFAGSNNLTYASQLLTSIAIDSAHAGMVVTNGYMQADAGFLATVGTATTYNAINAPGGGMGAKSFTAVNYIQAGTWSSGSTATPVLTSGDSPHPGLLSWDTATNSLKVYNGSAMVAVGGGGGSGVTSLNGLSGVLAIQGTSNQIIVTPSGSNVTLTTPQAIGTGSAVNFGSVTTSTFVASSSVGGALAFQGGGGTTQILGDGTASFAGVISSTGATGGLAVTNHATFNSIQTNGGGNFCAGGGCTGGTAINVNGVNVVNSIGQFVGPGANFGNFGISAAGYNTFGGGIGQSVTVNFAGGFVIGGNTFHNLVFTGGVLTTFN